ncbi:MAG TPA: DNA-J related domain-containing protein [Candidatus Methylomirabilis sp.]|nr:DNA-J related domain-containing protein [Candidatus Methylomirabilis sp.]
MPDNPFKGAILALIREFPLGLTEYDLIQRLQERDETFAVDGENADLALFRKHFLVMNALYQLQSELYDAGMYLSISPLDIRLEPVQASGLPSPPAENSAALRDYYLSWDNLLQTGSADVAAMLRRFHARYLALDERQKAMQTLELPADARWETIKQTYRRLAAQHHPDKGGDPARFRAIRAAYEILLQCYSM